jgi:hypothetical protein
LGIREGALSPQHGQPATCKLCRIEVLLSGVGVSVAQLLVDFCPHGVGRSPRAFSAFLRGKHDTAFLLSFRESQKRRNEPDDMMSPH